MVKSTRGWRTTDEIKCISALCSERRISFASQKRRALKLMYNHFQSWMKIAASWGLVAFLLSVIEAPLTIFFRFELHCVTMQSTKILRSATISYDTLCRTRHASSSCYSCLLFLRQVSSIQKSSSLTKWALRDELITFALFDDAAITTSIALTCN